MVDLHEQCKRYIQDMIEYRESSPNTVKNYRATITKFCEWAVANGHTLDEDTIRQYVSQIRNKVTANAVQVRLRGFAKFSRVDTSALKPAKCDVKKVVALTSHEVTSLLEVMQDEDDPRIHAVATLLVRTGLRFNEYCELRPDMLEYTPDGACTISIVGKGRKHRKVPISPEVQAIWDHLPFQPRKAHQDIIRAALKGAGVVAGLKLEVHPHLFRKTFISVALNEKNQEPLFIAQIVGHSNLTMMLKHYAAMSADKLYSLV